MTRSGRAVERGDEIAHTTVTAGGADDNLVFNGKRGGGELEVGLAVAEVRLPHDLAVVLVGGNDARRIVGARDDEVTPERGATVRQRQLLLAGIHPPDDAARVAGAAVDLVDDAPLVDDVEVAVLPEWRRLQVFVVALRRTPNTIRFAVGFFAWHIVACNEYYGRDGGHLLRSIKRMLLWVSVALGTAALSLFALITCPESFFAFSLGSGKIVVASDRPIPPAGGERFLRDCERLLGRSPLKAGGHQYRLYVTNEDWRKRLFFIPSPDAWGFTWYLIGFGGHAFISGADFDSGRVVHWGYIGTPPRTLASLCAHELTHVISWEHVGLDRLHVPKWVWEGFADYVAIEDGWTFEQLRDALGDRPVDTPMRVKYGFYPRYRLLVLYFVGKKGWSVDQLFQTRLTEDEATAMMRADKNR
jgi:hypothetical protein